MCRARFRRTLVALAPASRARLNGLSQRARRVRRRFLESKNGTRGMSQSNGNGVAVVADVAVVRRLDLGWQCMIEGRPVFVANLQIPPGFVMPVEGETGPIMLTAAAIRDLGIPPHAVRRR